MLNEPIVSVMTDDVQTVGPDQTLADVLDIVVEYAVHHVPVVADARLVGLLSTTDLVPTGSDSRRRLGGRAANNEFEKTPVLRVMQEELITVPVGGTLLEAAELLARGDIHAVPVVGEDKSLAGIVTSTDLIRFLLNHLDLDANDHNGLVDELDEPRPENL